ncbi:MAG: DUF2975 domain-containing protein [Lachnospiraceae bacterium]|nr:DUF2975 domain-containing protein [Lachnospiraceae bacterium]
MSKKIDRPEKKRLQRYHLVTGLATVIIILLLFQVEDFVKALIAKSDSYEIRYELAMDTVTNGQQVYKLYKNGEYMADVDPNQYERLDDNGNMDVRYCVLMEEAKRLTYSIILGAMMLVVMVIVGSTGKGSPFTHSNAKRIRLIGALQFALAIVPGLVMFLMSFFKFEYAYLPFTLNGFYMLVVGFAIMVIAQVFDYGVKLQEDVDLIA